MITFACPNGHSLTAGDEYAGKRVRCTQCQATFVVPESAPRPQEGNVESPPVARISVGSDIVDTSAQTLGGNDDGHLGMLAALGRRSYAKAGVCAGIILIIFSKGCSVQHEMHVVHLQAQRAALSREFDQETAELLDDIEGEEFRTTEMERRALKKVTAATWEPTMDDVESALDARTRIAYWSQWSFMLGAMVLAFGLLHVGFHGSGSERIVCLIMVAIIVYSLFVGGQGWVEATVSPPDAGRR